MTRQSRISLERAIYSLIPELVEIRQEFIKMLNLFSEDLEAYREVIVSAGTQAEHLVKWLEESSSVRTDDISLMRKIENLQTGGIVPAEIASYFHTLRVFSNKARHRAENLTFKRRDVENIFGILLSVYEWANCDYEKGPRYPSIYRELPRIPNMIGNSIAPSGVLYCGVAPFIGSLFQWVGVESDFGFLALIVSILAVTFLVQFVRTKRFLGLRSQSDSVLRFQSYSALFFVSLLVILNSPLLETSYTGIDSYGLFLFFRKNPKLWAIISNLILNFLLASGATILFFWIGLEWAKRKPQDVVYSTFSTVLFPLGVAYILVAFSQKIGLESFILVAFFPLALAFIAIIGYSHSNNHLDLFTAKLLLILSIVFMVLGFFLTMGGMVFKLYEFSNTKPQNVFETHLWMRTFSWETLGLTAERFVEKLKLGFTWMVLTASFYLELAVGTAAVMTIYSYQLRPAIDKQGKTA